MDQGIGLVIENEQGERMIFDEESRLMPLQVNSNVLQLFVMLEIYERTDRIQLGNFSSQAIFRIGYK